MSDHEQEQHHEQSAEQAEASVMNDESSELVESDASAASLSENTGDSAEQAQSDDTEEDEGLANEANEEVVALDEIMGQEGSSEGNESDADTTEAQIGSEEIDDSADASSSDVQSGEIDSGSDNDSEETKDEAAFEEVPDDELVEEVDDEMLRKIIEGALLAAGKALNIAKLKTLFPEVACPSDEKILEVLDCISAACEDRGFELKEVASGFRFQVRQELSPWVGRLWEEKPQRYTRALLETLSLIAYRQPITRGEIEEIRGVSVSSSIVRTLMERDWVRIVGHRDVPGRPAMYATTRDFLDYFNLKNLDELPSLSEIRDLDELNKKLELEERSPEGVSLSMPAAEDGEEQDSVLDEIDFKEIDALNKSFEKPKEEEQEEGSVQDDLLAVSETEVIEISVQDEELNDTAGEPVEQGAASNSEEGDKSKTFEPTSTDQPG